MPNVEPDNEETQRGHAKGLTKTKLVHMSRIQKDKRV